jgi:hypothetical protein
MATPNPIMKRAAINIWMLRPIDWRTTPTIMRMQPVIIPARRPKISAMYGVIGRAIMLPTDMIAFRSPRVGALGLLNAETNL